jgi:hypothetical protein
MLQLKKGLEKEALLYSFTDTFYSFTDYFSV